ncbi:MAG: hypothetical protein PVI06_15605 [Desulfobacterales bacterium]
MRNLSQLNCFLGEAQATAKVKKGLETVPSEAIKPLTITVV